jgi:glycosyltransferase involved in cell wall biosynthesis
MHYQEYYVIKVLSLHWGFSVGGIGKYASIIDTVSNFRDVNIKSLCILSTKKQIDHKTLDELEDKELLYYKGLLDFLWVSKLREYIEEYKPDIVITHGFNGHIIANIFLRKYQCASSYHGEYHAETYIKRILGIFYNKFTEIYIANRSIGTVCVAENSKSYLIDKGVPSNKITVIHNGIDVNDGVETGARDKLRIEWGISPSDILLGTTSRVEPIKGIKYLLNAFKELSKKYDNLKLVIIGTGSLEDVLFNTIKGTTFENRVIFTGFRDDISNCLSAIDIFVLPSLSECHSIALLEAMRAKKVIVSSDVGGNTESVRHQEEALIVPPGDFLALVKEIGRLVEEPDLAERLANQAERRFLSIFTNEIMIEKTAVWLEDVRKDKL